MKTTKNGREAAMAAIKKKFGTEVLPADEVEDLLPECIPTGSFQLDLKTGIGGYPRGGIIEIYGPNASGKTSLTLHAIAEANKMGQRCAFIDAENALDRDYARDLGVDLSMMDYHRPHSGEEALDVLEMLAESDAYSLIALDSVAALVPLKELEGEMGQSHVGLQARLMGQAMRKITTKLRDSKTTAIFLNQTREKVGMMYGNPETTSGGNSLAFYATLRFRVSPAPGKAADLLDPISGEVIGGRKRVKIIKNKMAGTAKHEVIFTLHANNEYGCGIDKMREIFDMAEAAGFIDKAGAWYSYNGERLGQGADNAYKAMDNSVLISMQKDLIDISRVKQPVKDRMKAALDG